MMNVQTTMYIGIVIIGAMMVLVTAFLIVKSTSKNSSVKSRPSDDIENIEVKPAMEKKHAPHNEKIDNRESLAPWKIKRDILKGIRALRKRSTSPDPQPLDEVLTLKEQQLTPLPDNTGLELQTNTLPPLTDQETSNIELVNEEDTKENMISTSPEELGQSSSNVEPANEEEKEENIFDKFPPELAESTPEQLQEEPEDVENEPVEEYKAPDNEYQEEPKADDDVLDLFKSEVVGENDAGILAANLDNVEIHDLLEEAQKLMNQLKGRSHD